MANELLIRINGTAKDFRDELAKVKQDTKNLEAGLKTTAKVSAAAFVALAGSVAVTVQRFGAFEKTFSNVVTLLDESSFKTKTFEQGVNSMKEEIIKLGAQTGESFDALNNGLFDLVSAGVDAEKATKTLAAATDLAIAGATDTATAVKALTAAITSYGDEAGSADDIAEKFFTAQKFGVTTVGELATEFNKVAGLSKQLGLSFDETLAASTALTANGAKPTAQAFTEMRAVLNSVILAQSRLTNASPALQKALSLQNIRQVGLVKALNDTVKATGGNVVELQKLLGSAEALSAALSLTGAQAESFTTIMEGMNDETQRSNNFQDALAVKNATTEKSIARLKQTADAVAVTFGEIFAPTINDLADALKSVAQYFLDMDDSTKQAIASGTKIAAILSGVVAGLAGLGVAILKMIGLQSALRVAFAESAIAARAFWGAATGGALVVISLLPQVITFLKQIAGIKIEKPVIVDEENLKTAKDIKSALRDLRSEYNSLDIQRNAGSALEISSRGRRISAIDGEIKRLEKLLETKKREEEFAAFTPAQKEQEIFGKQTITTNTENTGPSLDEELAAVAEKNQALFDEQQAANEELAAQDEEYKNLKKEANSIFDEEEIGEVNNQLLTKKQLNEKFAKEEFKRKVKEREQYIKDEKLFGKTIADLDSALASKKVGSAKKLSSSLIGLTQSRNATLKAIGKAAAVTSITINTAESASSAYKSAVELFGVIAGPIVGGAAVAALVAFGAEQIGNVLSAQRGGIVPQGSGGSNDRIPALLQPGELIVPRALTPDFIQSAGRPGDGGGVEGGIVDDETAPAESAEIRLTLQDDLMDFVEAQLIERGRLKLSLQGA